MMERENTDNQSNNSNSNSNNNNEVEEQVRTKKKVLECIARGVPISSLAFGRYDWTGGVSAFTSFSSSSSSSSSSSPFIDLPDDRFVE